MRRIDVSEEKEFFSKEIGENLLGPISGAPASPTTAGSGS